MENKKYTPNRIEIIINLLYYLPSRAETPTRHACTYSFINIMSSTYDKISRLKGSKITNNIK